VAVEVDHLGVLRNSIVSNEFRMNVVLQTQAPGAP
jgi:hypothetical protein